MTIIWILNIAWLFASVYFPFFGCCCQFKVQNKQYSHVQHGRFWCNTIISGFLHFNMADVPRGWSIFTKPHQFLKTYVLIVIWEISCAFEHFRGFWENICLEISIFQCCKDSSMHRWLTACWPHPTKFIFTNLNYTSRGLLSTQTFTAVQGFSFIRLHEITLGSCPLQEQSTTHCLLKQLKAKISPTSTLTGTHSTSTGFSLRVNRPAGFELLTSQIQIQISLGYDCT